MRLTPKQIQGLDALEVALTALTGVKSLQRINIPHDPLLHYFEMTVDPIVIGNVKNQVLQNLMPHLELLFSNSSQWQGGPGRAGKPYLYLVDANGLQMMIGVFGHGTRPERMSVAWIPEFLLTYPEDQPAAVYLEGLLVALRHLRSGSALGAQTALYRCFEALRVMLALHFQPEGATEADFPASLSWALLSNQLPSDLVRLLEEVLGDMRPEALCSHFVQLTNVTLHLLEAVAPEQLTQVPVVGLAKAREWLERGLLFRRGYIGQPTLFEGFNALSKSVFGLDFTPWVASGQWTSQYQPYTFFHNKEAIANVSMTQITLLLEGDQVPAIQIGTVMTHPKWRRQGLSRELFERIFADYPPTEHLYFLAADAEAVPLYEACGFKRWQALRYWVDIPTRHHLGKQGPRLFGQRVEGCTLEQLVALHQASEPVSWMLGALDDACILAFYGVMGLSDCLYEIEPGIFALMAPRRIEEEGQYHEQEVIVVYRLFVPEKGNYNFNHFIVKAGESGYARVEFLFCPDQSADLVSGLQTAALEDGDGGWMVHTGYGRSFPPRGRFPKISQT